MSKHLSLVCISLIFFLFSACEPDNIEKLQGRLEIEPLVTDNAGSRINKNPLQIWMGEVPLYSKSLARFKLTNPSQKIVHISQVVVRNSKGQGRFIVEDFAKEVFPTNQLSEDTYVTISYQPYAKWHDANNNQRVDDKEMDQASLLLYSDAKLASEVELTVTGYGVDNGAPTVQLCYNDYCGPTDGECINSRCELAQPLNFGNVSLGSTGSARLKITNLAQCQYPDEWDVCQHQDYCALVLDKDINNHNLGLAVLSNLENGDRFTIFDGASLPLAIPQKASSGDGCQVAQTYDVRLFYQARDTVQIDKGRLVLETNDPRAAVIYVPLQATSTQVPQAVCRLRAADPDNPQNPSSVAGELRPYSRIYFDGTESHNPLDAENSEAVNRYSWKILSYPEGANPDDFTEHGISSGYFDFNAPLSGEYRIGLTVWNKDGIVSDETEESICVVQVVPGSKIHIQHTWDDPENDQDLHLVRLDDGGKVCNKDSDCFYQNRQPLWFDGSSAGVGPNPHLDHDDKDGLGPENLNIDEPLPGRYRIYVHYYEHPESSQRPAQPTMNSLRVYLNGVMAGQFSHILQTPKEMWAAADIVWGANPRIEPLGADGKGWICNVSYCNEDQDVSCEQN